MKVAIYLRVSTRGQGEEDRFGLPTQRANIEKYCKAHGHTIIGEYEDRGYSGATANRPALARLLADACAKNFEAVVVYKWDRLARDTTLDGYLRYRLRELGVATLSATEENSVNPASNLTQTILAAVAQFERTLITQRLVAARRLKLEQGGYVGGKPRYGMRAVNGNLEPNAPEQEAIALAKDLRRKRYSLREIGAELDSRGILPREGGKWVASAVKSILTRRKTVVPPGAGKTIGASPS